MWDGYREDGVFPPWGRAEAAVIQETTISFLLPAGRDTAVDRCGTESLSGWCFEAPATMAVGPGETQQVELRVAALGRHPEPLPNARLFVLDNCGRDAATVALGLRAAS